MPPRILLVDDDDAVRESLYAALERDGYDVLAASNGPEALAIFRKSVRPIELLVTDYNMPRMTGLQLARRCAQMQSDLSVLYVSGSQPDAGLQAEMQAPRRAFVAKPFRRDEFLRKARGLLEAASPVQLALRL